MDTSAPYSYNLNNPQANMIYAQNVVAVPVPPPSKMKNQLPIIANDTAFLDQVTNNNRDYNLPAEDHSTEIGEEQITRLTEQGYTTGLAKALSKNHKSFPLRIWVVDNSGSMLTTDGHRIIETVNANDVRMVGCTRWEEIRECVNYHAKLAGLLEAPTVFRLLNDPGAMIGPQQFGVAEMGSSMISENLYQVASIMGKTHPRGCTPLTHHINYVQQSVKSMAPDLNRQGRRVAVIIATDGLPTDIQGYGGSHIQKEFVDALRSLEGLPVWIVIRLCTDDDEVVNFYNELDEHLELSLEVLDDFVGEAKEVYSFNKWLNYALPIHRIREMGFHERVFDLIDERTLTKSEVRDFCAILFGDDKFDGVPDPSVNWEGFSNQISSLLKHEKYQWNPITKRKMPWIDMRALNQTYGDETLCGCNIM